MRSVIVGVVAVALVCSELGAQTSDPTPALKERVSAFQTAWNAHDGAAVAALYAPDADQIMGDGAIAQGKAAIQRWWIDRFATAPKGTTISFSVRSVRGITADVAVVNVVATVTGPAPSGGGMSATDDRGTWLMVRRGGQWLLSALRVQQAERLAGK
jgi:uncharacterized protein (TIGR02246 family)